ncbi:MAG: NUDIX domain-containing protein [Mesorhizobium sp.]
MAGFSESYLGRLRAIVGNRCLLVPGARVVVRDQPGRILLQHRTDFDIWGLPGGNAEEGEDLEDVVRREVLEETGIVVGALQPFGFANDPEFETIEFPNGDKCQFFALMFHTREFSGEARAADDESHAVEWFDPGNLPSLLPNMRRSIDALAEFERTGRFQII